MGKFAYGPNNQIPSAQQAVGLDVNSIMAGWVDRGKWVYYDTLTQAAGSAALATNSFFVNGLGTADPITTLTKTKLQTNLPNGRFFNPPRCLILDQLGFMFTGAQTLSASVPKLQTVLADIEQFCFSSYFEFKIDEKIFFEGLLQFHPPGYGITGYSSGNNEEAWGLGIPSPLATYCFGNFAKYIAPLQNFSLTITFPGSTLPVWTTSGQGINLVVFMKGLTDRSVQ